MSKRERPFYPGPDDELDGKTDDEEANSDHESDPIQSSDNSNYESETDVTDSEKSDSESDQSDKQNVTAGDTEPLARYSRRRPLKIETKGFQSASREQIPPTQQDELQEAKRRRDRAHLPYFVYGPTFNPPTLAGQPRVTAGERTVPTADPAASSKQVPAPVTPAKEVPAPVAAANVVPAPVTPSNVVAAPLSTSNEVPAPSASPCVPPTGPAVTWAPSRTPSAPKAATPPDVVGHDQQPRPVLNMPSKPVKTRKDVMAKIAAGANYFECPLCHLLLLSKSSQQKHTENHYKAKVDKPALHCPRCAKEYKNKSAMENHMNESECWRKWFPGPLPQDKTQIPDLPEDGHPLVDLSQHNPAMLFSRFFDPLVPIWRRHTNRAGAQIYTKERAKKFKRGPWAFLSKLGAYKWMTMFLAWGLLGLDRVRAPWQKDWLFLNPFYVSWTSGNRFEQIVHASHFVDNDYETKPGRRGCPNSENYDRLWRIRDVINEFCRISQATWDPGRNLTIDEMMVLFKGRWGHITLMPKKPIKKGIKLFALADSSTGFVLNFIPSTGEHYPEYPILKKTGATMVALLRGDNLPEGWARDYLYRGHFLFTDNYYTAFKTMEWLRRHCVYYRGTIRKDKRRVPEFMREAVHPSGREYTRGEMRFAHSSTGLQLCLWLDNKTVITASNIPEVTDDKRFTERVISYKKKKKKIYEGKRWIPEPEIVWLYNKYMKGIDISDQLIAKCHHQFKTKKWFIPIWYQIIDMCVLNSFIIYKHYYMIRFPEAPQLTTPVFRRMLVESLRNHVEAVEKPKAWVPPQQSNVVDEMPHTELPLVETLNVDKLGREEKRQIARIRLDTSKGHRPARCIRRTCHVHCQERRTKYACAVCKIAMCPTPCYERFHFSHYYKYNDPKLGKRKAGFSKSHPFVLQ